MDKKALFHKIGWFLADLLLIIPICILLMLFGQIIQDKRSDSEEESSSVQELTEIPSYEYII